MAEVFVCKNVTGQVLANWVIGVDGDDLTLTTRCNFLIAQQSIRGLVGNPINTGDSPVLSGDWTKILSNILPTQISALENLPLVNNTALPDRHAHQAIRTSLAERIDAIIGQLSNLNLDDKYKFEQRMMRDISMVLRALEGDIYILQQMIGQVMVRLDKLENWSVAQTGVPLPAFSNNYADPRDPPRVPFPDLPQGAEFWDFGSDIPINPAEFHNSFVPHNHASDVQSDFVYHQGYHSVHPLKRYWNAARAMGIDEPEVIDPRSSEPFSDKRYNQGAY